MSSQGLQPSVFFKRTVKALGIYRLISFYWVHIIWTASSEFGTYRLCEQRWFSRACASMQSRQNLRCSLIQAVSQEEPSDRKPDPWPFWIAGHAQLKFVMTECSKTQIHLTGSFYRFNIIKPGQTQTVWYMYNHYYFLLCSFMQRGVRGTNACLMNEFTGGREVP